MEKIFWRGEKFSEGMLKFGGFQIFQRGLICFVKGAVIFTSGGGGGGGGWSERLFRNRAMPPRSCSKNLCSLSTKNGNVMIPTQQAIWR